MFTCCWIILFDFRVRDNYTQLYLDKTNSNSFFFVVDAQKKKNYYLVSIIWNYDSFSNRTYYQSVHQQKHASIQIKCLDNHFFCLSIRQQILFFLNNLWIITRKLGGSSRNWFISWLFERNCKDLPGTYTKHIFHLSIIPRILWYPYSKCRCLYSIPPRPHTHTKKKSVNFVHCL